jgi:hypothetical protein
VRKIQRVCWGLIALLVTFLLVNAEVSLAQTPLTTIDMPQGGRIVYGKVQGADTQGAAMTHVLRVMHQSCGERPQIGHVFKMRDTDSVGLFFTVVNHPAGNVPVAGLIIAAGSAAHQAEAALVSDRADRFGSTINPMLNKLFSVWHPGGATVDASAPPAKSSASAPAKSASSGPAPKLHTVSAADNSGSIGIPDGWTLDPNSGRGAIIVHGPQGEVVALGMFKTGVDPTHPWQRNFARNGGRPMPGQPVYPYHGNLKEAFQGLFQAWRRSNGLGPAKLQVDKIDPFPVPPGSPLGRGEECVIANGHIDADGKGNLRFNDLMCAALAFDWGGFPVTLDHSVAPDSVADQEKPAFKAMLASWKLNIEVLNQQTQAALRDKAASDAQIQAQTQRVIDNIHAIGAQATARYNATQAANDAQHAAWNQSQDNISRNGQGFSNYLLDQTVIHDVQDPNTHVTVWNNAAEAWKKAYPDRIEEVPTSQYINGQDY